MEQILSYPSVHMKVTGDFLDLNNPKYMEQLTDLKPVPLCFGRRTNLNGLSKNSRLPDIERAYPGLVNLPFRDSTSPEKSSRIC